MPSPISTRSFGLSKAPRCTAKKCSFAMATTSASISHIVTCSTEGCLSASSEEPPSPPPMISTFFGAACAVSAGMDQVLVVDELLPLGGHVAAVQAEDAPVVRRVVDRQLVVLRLPLADLARGLDVEAGRVVERLHEQVFVALGLGHVRAPLKMRRRNPLPNFPGCASASPHCGVLLCSSDSFNSSCVPRLRAFHRPPRRSVCARWRFCLEVSAIAIR